ncbi:MAG: hypothetical protein ACRCVT_15265, partial [Leadbetterella sp.]
MPEPPIKFLILISIILCSGTQSKGQFPINIQKILLSVEKNHINQPEEKVFIHTDKDKYMAGDTIWFKAYLFDVHLNSIDFASRVLYVELCHPDNPQPLAREKIECLGTGNGYLALPLNYASGYYQIRAYTSYMQNFQEALFFKKNVLISAFTDSKVNTNKSSINFSAPSINEVKRLDFNFFPEGGYCINQIESRMACKLTDLNGNGIDFTGIVLDSRGDTIRKIKSEHLGMGYFYHVPVLGQKYKTIITTSGGQRLEKELPECLPKGALLTVDNTTQPERIRVFVLKTPQMSQSSDLKYFVFIHQKGKILSTVTVPDSSQKYSFAIATKSILNPGLLSLTLCDQTGKIWSERIVFIENNQKTKLFVDTSPKLVGKRQKVSVSIQAQDAIGNPVQGDFSLAITDRSLVFFNPDQENIDSYINLSSHLKSLFGEDPTFEIRGKIQDPNYYFKENIKESKIHLDVLLMTQGWRRYTLDLQKIDTTIPPKHPLELGLNFEVVTKRLSGKPLANAPVTLFFKKKPSDFESETSPKLLFGITNTEGKYIFQNVPFVDSTLIYIQGRRGKGGSLLEIESKEWECPQEINLLSIPKYQEKVDTQLVEFVSQSYEIIERKNISKMKQSTELNEVVIKAKKEDPLDERRIYSPSNTLMVTKELCSSFFNVFDMISGRFAGVQVTNSGGSYSVLIRGITSLTGSNQPYYLLDGMPVDAETIS